MSLADHRKELDRAAGKLRQAKVNHLQAFIDLLASSEFRAQIDQEASAFHELLIATQQQHPALVHYSRLSAGMGIKDPSNCSRWFYDEDSGKCKTPDQFRRRYALLSLQRIFERDVERMNEGLKPIGGLSMREHPQLEFRALTGAAHTPLDEKPSP